MQTPKVLTITGSRYFSKECLPAIHERLEQLVNEPYDKIYLGGAIGIDTICLFGLNKSKAQLNVVVPFRLEDQPKSTWEVSRLVHNVIELDLPRNKFSYILRNRYMVDLSTNVLSFWTGEPGGTQSTMEYARSLSIPVEVIGLNNGTNN